MQGSRHDSVLHAAAAVVLLLTGVTASLPAAEPAGPQARSGTSAPSPVDLAPSDALRVTVNPDGSVALSADSSPNAAPPSPEASREPDGSAPRGGAAEPEKHDSGPGEGLLLDVLACRGVHCFDSIPVESTASPDGSTGPADPSVVRASDLPVADRRHPQPELTFQPGEEAGFLVRMSIDCVFPADLGGLARLLRVVIVPTGTRTLHCPLEPVDARCQFRFWKDDVRALDELAADPMPHEAPPSGRTDVDQAEASIRIDGHLPEGGWSVVAALPEDLVDMFPCERVREHAWLQSKPLEFLVVDPRRQAEREEAVAAFEQARAAGDCRLMRVRLHDLEALLSDVHPPVRPDMGKLNSELLRACGDSALDEAPPRDR